MVEDKMDEMSMAELILLSWPHAEVTSPDGSWYVVKTKAHSKLFFAISYYFFEINTIFFYWQLNFGRSISVLRTKQTICADFRLWGPEFQFEYRDFNLNLQQFLAVPSHLTTIQLVCAAVEDLENESEIEKKDLQK